MKKISKDVLEKKIIAMAKRANESAHLLSVLATEKKNAALFAMADNILNSKAVILKANQKDLVQAQKKNLSKAFIDRLTLDEKRVNEMADSLRQIAKLNDPVGEVIKTWDRPNGLSISKVRVPIGVILTIYESRPNVTSDCIGLCFKSGNVAILRGGSDAINSNTALFDILEKSIIDSGLPKGFINLVRDTDRRAVDVLLSLDKYIYLVMPRGGEALINEVRDKAKMPIIKHYKGVCHIFVDESADFAMAQRIILNAKVQRPGVCNAVETLLVHERIAKDFLSSMIESFEDAGVEVRGCEATRKVVKNIKKATEKDWFTEYLDMIISVRVVKDVMEAISHINHYGSNHSDSIVTKDSANAERFLKEVDSACVYVNASTRFTDGYQFGLGAEIGISTDRLHARGPMGLEELTTYKYVIRGNGQIRE